MFPGGLRAQLVLSLSVLLLGAGALGALLVENVLTRRLLDTRVEQARVVARLATHASQAEREALVREEVVAGLATTEGSHGDDAVVAGLRATATGQRVFVADGRRFLAVRSGEMAVAVPVDEIERDVGSIRSALLVFALLVAVVVMALGYAFFGFVVVRPIRAIGVATERAAKGDLASPITVVPRNEFGRVANSFNQMLLQLDRSRAELEERLEELEAANNELASTRDSLIRSEKLASVGQLAAGIAHEIGNPLAALSGYNELLCDPELDPDDARDLLRRSGVQLERIREVIRNLLDFSRDESGAQPEPTSLAACVEETVSLVGAGARKRNVELDVGELDGPLVRVVASQLVQVLVNLAMNAVDALPDGGRVRFVREDADGFATLRVEDDGAGIDPALASKIFDPFFTTKEPGEGTGLGLAISARIVESFGGTLELQTSELGGARFDVKLPLESA